MPRQTAHTIAHTLRKRICLEPPASSPILHEQTIAEEFGVSRTPVRQALQRLAYERLVEVKTGIGTVVAPLDPAEKVRDVGLAFALIGVASDFEGDRRLSEEANARIAALNDQVVRARTLDLETNYHIRATSLNLITREMSSDILAETLKAALWRLFRWRIAEAAASPTGFDHRLREVMAQLNEATRIGTLRALLNALRSRPPQT